jgi:hypothetical protein
MPGRKPLQIHLPKSRKAPSRALGKVGVETPVRSGGKGNRKTKEAKDCPDRNAQFPQDTSKWNRIDRFESPDRVVTFHRTPSPTAGGALH